MPIAGMVLVGGRSSRMGSPKAALDWRGRPLLTHVLDALGPTCSTCYVVAAPGQDVPPTTGVVIRDEIPGGGPVAGVAAGLAAAARDGAQVAVVCSTDLPLLAAEFVARLVALLRDTDDGVVPVVGGWVQPLVAVYRTSLAGRAAELAADAAPVRALSRVAAIREVSEAELLGDDALRAADPTLASVRGVNTPSELDAARRWGR